MLILTLSFVIVLSVLNSPAKKPRHLAIKSPRQLATKSPRHLAIKSPRQLATKSPRQLAESWAVGLYNPTAQPVVLHLYSLKAFLMGSTMSSFSQLKNWTVFCCDLSFFYTVTSASAKAAAEGGATRGTSTPTRATSSVSNAPNAYTSISSHATACWNASAPCSATRTSSTTARCRTPTSSARRPSAKAAQCATSALCATPRANNDNATRAYRAI